MAVEVLAEYHFGGEFKNCKCQIVGDMEELLAHKEERDKHLGIVAERLLEEEWRRKNGLAV